MSQQTHDLSRFLADRYSSVKAHFPGEGRRRWRLRVAEQFWALSPEDKQKSAAVPPVVEAEAEDAPYCMDDDPLDGVSIDALGLGIVVRTDFSNEDAWQAFCDTLQAAEAEFSSVPEGAMDVEADEVPGESSKDDVMDEDDSEDVDVDENAPIFHLISDPSQRTVLESLSNLAALRLLNDVDVRPAPTPPTGTKRVKPPNRLVDCHGWQEIYTGKMLWIYDSKSNVDQCVRLVSQQGAMMYGTATADSWRARVSHICELQVNLASGAMKIDFGGMDHWDYPERVRNMEEAERLIT
ncbi:hypothetical protein PHLGIDRAFT_129092 [Phlebiopsis gigantea 11061_1 CR5-6]|uniref:Uncharacterized protein n=1 Tax=Phlebiopsis gigantea (strain 11061_1 CR5-6) TaxID=745531 RepID=A0A0C3RV61_PHLG1|nr:hypothetical protein PHLGIDRAFT_129092 [Phlebiopsis gigantea 11061_1 CR5-6]